MKWLALSGLFFSALFADTIEDKISKVEMAVNADNAGASLNEVNAEIASLRDQLSLAFDQVPKCKDTKDYQTLLEKVNHIRTSLRMREETWRRLAVDRASGHEEGYALWDQEETLISQLVMEYGSSDYLYVVPPEVAAMKIHVHSQVPIPRESWSDLLEVILVQNGVGVKELNSYGKQLYLLKQNLIAVKDVVADVNELKRFSDGDRVIFVFTPDPDKSKGVSQFFDRFRDPKVTTVYQVGYKIVVVSVKPEIQKLLDLYEAVWEEGEEKVSKVFTLKRLAPLDMEKILKAFFGDAKRRLSLARGQEDDLTIFTLPQEGAIVVVGRQDHVERAEVVIKDTEEQICDPAEMTVSWYTCRHSDPIEVSEALEKVYASLVCARVDGGLEAPQTEIKVENNPVTAGQPPLTISPQPIQAATLKSQKQTSNSKNFVPYAKTGSIMMVVRKDTLPKIKELLKKLDVPKKMVRIEVLLFEKKRTNTNNFGLNVLKLGESAKKVNQTGLTYDHPKTGGILDFFISRKTTSWFPAFDLSYNFLMAQEDARINAAPSILTLNQTPGKTSIMEEISIDNGAAPIDTASGGITFEKVFSRVQYGINIVCTPTIHEPDAEGERFVTLETDVSFDTTKDKGNDRPDVDRRQVQNQVRIKDGQTVILGGLQKKVAEDTTEKIPFFGDLPGIGKFFATTKSKDQMTELFMFITPHIILDEERDLEKMRTEILMRRPGDLPEFLEEIELAKSREKERLFYNSFQLLFGHAND